MFVVPLPAMRGPLERSCAIFSNLPLMLCPVSPLTANFRGPFCARPPPPPPLVPPPPLLPFPPTNVYKTLVLPPTAVRWARLLAEGVLSMAIGVALPLPFFTPPLTDTGVFLTLMATPLLPLGVVVAAFFPALGFDLGGGLTPLDGVFFFFGAA